MNKKLTLSDLLAQLIVMNEPCDHTLDMIKYRYPDAYHKLMMAFNENQSCMDAVLPIYLNSFRQPVQPTIIKSSSTAQAQSYH